MSGATPRFDRDAERSVLGAVLSAGSYGPETGWRVFDRARSTGLSADCFYLATHGSLWAELERLREAEISLDPLSVSAELEQCVEERVGPLSSLLAVDVGELRGRLYELAAEVTSFSNVEHHARLIVREHERRARDAA